MEALSSRERLLRSFEKSEVDRIPVSPFIYENFIKEFYNDPKADIIKGTIDVYKHFGFDNLSNISPLYRSSSWRI